MVELPKDNSTILIASDGSSNLYKISVKDKASQIEVVKHISKENGSNVGQINDLTVAPFNGKNYAFFNSFRTEDIYMADLETGQVVTSWNLQDLL